MNQILTIFKKDTRHLWPEILVSIILSAALVRIYPSTWLVHQYSNIVLEQIAVALIVLVPLGWWLLITRLIHSESLVGDRQFWITRPYEWQNLLAAKALFLFAFLYIPIFIAHCALLTEAGFHPFSFLPGLLYNLLMLTGVIILPLIAFATVTSTFVRMTLTLLAIVVAFLAVTALSATLTTQGANTPGDDDHLSFILFVAIFLTVILLQYATRRLWLSRAILGGLALLGVLMAFVPLDGYFVPLAYPQSASAAALVEFSYPFPSTPPISITTDADFAGPKAVSVSIPVKVSGIAAGQAISPDNVLVSIDAPNNLHWTSHWQPIYNMRLLPAVPVTRINIKIDRAFYNQVQSLPLSVHLTLALSQLQSGETTRVSLREGDFAVPGIGICSLPNNMNFIPTGSIRCRSAVRQPQLSYIQSFWSKGRCSDPSGQPDPNSPGSAWVGSVSRDPAELSLVSVWTPEINLSDQFIPADVGLSVRAEPRFLCPGTPLTVTHYRVIGRTQTRLTIPDLHLPPPRKIGIGVQSFGITQ